MRIAIATVKVPFIQGGAELHIQGLAQAVRRAGHDVDVIEVPFVFSPPASIEKIMDYWQELDFERFDCGPIDRVIAMKFPTWYLRHPRKTAWVMHQHRSVYELFDTAFGEQSSQPGALAFKQRITELDTQHLGNMGTVYANSQTVADRLKKYNGLDATALYHPPPLEEQLRPGPIFPYIFCPSRLEDLKRQDLLIRAMQHVRAPVTAIIAGDGGAAARYAQLVQELGLQDKVKLTGKIGVEQMLRYYRNALCVFFAPYQEDYGYITLEAMLSAKPIITCHDSAGPTEFVIDHQTGRVLPPDPLAIADAINAYWGDPEKCRHIGLQAREHYASLDIGWDHVVNTLVQ